MIPVGATKINDCLSVFRDKQEWTYFLGSYPINKHDSSDQTIFRLQTSIMIEMGLCQEIDIVNVFGVSRSCVSRSSRKLRNEGIASFFQPVKRRRGSTVLTKKKLADAADFLSRGYIASETAKEIDVHSDTLRKAIEDGRLQKPVAQKDISAKSSRDAIDAKAADQMGTACTRIGERTIAAFGICDGAPVRFESCLDVPNGGVLLALPSLLMCGLLEGADKILNVATGYYRTFHVLLLLAFMALCRIKTTEKIRGFSPGEFGKLIGLDRIPEVRCLRNKMHAISKDGSAERWAAHMSRYWMETNPESIGSFYIDGHVRVYHGDLTKLPKRYVSRQRLCLRGINDYWVCDAIGRPFFVVEKIIDPGLLKVLEENIVPRLIKDMPNQPSEDVLLKNKHRCRFVLVFDREGYSPGFFQRMWTTHRISCITYHKHPEEDWPERWFVEKDVLMPGGEMLSMKLAEMGSFVGSGKNALWVREIRKLTDTGHQTSLISTIFDLPHTDLAARMFSRWCQENFFRYMSQHFAIDLLMERGTQMFSDTERVVNPVWRELNRKRNSIRNKLKSQRAEFAKITMHPKDNDGSAKYEKWIKKKSISLEEIEDYEDELEKIKVECRKISKHITYGELDENDKFLRLPSERKCLMDTVRMTAYRAETAMAGLLTSPTVNFPQARSLLQNLFVTEADILPDNDKEEMIVRVHNASYPAANKALNILIEKLNDAEIIYPGTSMRLKYQLRGCAQNENVCQN